MALEGFIQGSAELAIKRVKREDVLQDLSNVIVRKSANVIDNVDQLARGVRELNTPSSVIWRKSLKAEVSLYNVLTGTAPSEYDCSISISLCWSGLSIAYTANTSPISLKKSFPRNG